MRSLTFTIEGEDLSAVVTVTEVDGNLVFDIELTSDNGTIGDLRGLFFDFADETLVEGLSVSGTDVTDYAFQTDDVTNLGNGANVNGEIVNERGEFDAGIEIGTSGVSNDDIQSTQFVLSHDTEALTLDDINLQDFAVRITSVGEDGGSRNDSLKLGGNATAAPDAIDDDDFMVDEDSTLSENVLVNDTDADGDQLGVVSVAGGTVGSAFAVMSAGGRTGELTIDADGSLIFDPLGNFDVLNDGQTDVVEVEYGISDGNGGSDIATVTITVNGVTPVSGKTIVGVSDYGTLEVSSNGVIPIGDTQLAGTIDGSTFTTDGAIIGNLGAAIGVTEVSGPGRLNVGADDLWVGYGGTGSLFIENGGIVTVDNGVTGPAATDGLDVIVGWTDGITTGTGVLEVRGAGSTLSLQGYNNFLQVGVDGGSGSVLIEDGGAIAAAQVRIGRFDGIGDMTVTGEGSLVTVSGAGESGSGRPLGGWLRIGREGEGSLTVQDGARLDVSAPAGTGEARVHVGERDGGDGTLNVLSGGHMSLSGDPDGEVTAFRVGQFTTGHVLVDGAGSELTIESTALNGQVATSEVIFGDHAGGDGTLEVKNGGLASITGPIEVTLGAGGIGGSGGTGSWEITSGGQVSIADVGIVLGQSNASTGSIGVAGFGSSLNVGGQIVVGDEGTGALTIDGGSVTSESAIIASRFGSNGSAVVSNAGDWNIANEDLWVGYGGTGSLFIENGGIVTVDNGVTGPAPFDGLEVVVGYTDGISQGDGSLEVTGTGSKLSVEGFNNFLRVGYEGGSGNLLVADGGTISTSSLDIANNGGIGNARITGAGSLAIADGPGTTGGSGDPLAGYLGVGRDGGSGILTIENDGRLEMIGEPGEGEVRVFVGRDDADGTINILSGGQFEISADPIGGSTRFQVGRNGGTGTVVVDGPGSFLSMVTTGAGPGLEIGLNSDGDGSLEITNGGLVGVTGGNDVTVATRSDTSSGSVDVIGPQSTLEVEGHLVVADEGTGALTIDGGTVTSEGAIIGNLSGSDGSAVVSNSGQWNIGADRLEVGLGGTGSLRIESGGSVTVDNDVASPDPLTDKLDVNIGWTDGATAGNGSVVVSGEGSNLSVEGFNNFLRVGYEGGTGSLLVEDGGTLNTAQLGVGRANAFGDATVTGEGSLAGINGPSFTNSGQVRAGYFEVGRDGGDGTLTIDGGGRLEMFSDTGQGALQAFVGRDGGDGAMNVLAGGSFQMLASAGGGDVRLWIGRDGGNGVLNVENGGDVELIAGEGSGDLVVQIGRGNGGVGTLNIAGGGQFQTFADPAGGRGSFEIGVLGGSGNVSVDGENSLLAITTTEDVITFLVGSVHENSTGTLEITGGGQVSVTGEGDASIGSGSLGVTSSTGSVLVGGPQSSFSVESDLFVGRYGTGSLLIDGGGSASAYQVFVGREAGSTGSVTVNGLGSSLNAESQIVVADEGTGALTIDGGTVTSEGAIVGNVSGSDGSAVVSGSGQWNIGADRLEIGLGGSGSLQIESGGSVTVDNGVTSPDPLTDKLDVNIGWTDGATAGDGSVVITGEGSTLSAEGFNNFVRVGYEGGTGSLLVEDGATLGTANLDVGRLNGSGDATITGDNSLAIINGASFSGSGQLLAGYFGVGRDGGIGTLTIEENARMEMIADPLTGIVQAFVGRDGGDGTLNILTGGELEIGADAIGSRARILVGREADGSVNISGGGRLALSSDASGEGVIAVGNGDGGYGTLNIQDGGRLDLSAGSPGDTLKFYIGENDGGTGLVMVDGVGSQIVVEATPNNHTMRLGIGDNSHGTLQIKNGAEVIVNGSNDTYIGDFGSSTGIVDIASGGSLTTTGIGNFIVGNQEEATGSVTVNGSQSSLNVDNDLIVGAQGTGDLFIEGDAAITASRVDIGANGSLQGDTGTIDGDLSFDGGELVIDIGGTAAGQFDQFDVTGNAEFNTGIVHLNFVGGFAPQAGDTFQFITSNGGFYDPVMGLAITGLAAEAGQNISDVGGVGVTFNLSGVSEADTTFFFGAEAADVFDAGAGDDVFDSGAGDDILTGNIGDDLFIFNSNNSHFTITDFTPGAGSEDVIDISDYGFADFSALLGAATDVNSDVVIQLSVDATLTLNNVQEAQLHADDFILTV